MYFVFSTRRIGLKFDTIIAVRSARNSYGQVAIDMGKSPTTHAEASNDTIRKFGYPATCVADYSSWTVLLRPQQITLGALILACRKSATKFSAIGKDAFNELNLVTGHIESALADAFAYDKLNYLMLMMVDPHVHFHVVPRYSDLRSFRGLSFADPGWPATPQLGASTEMDDAQRSALISHLRELWPDREVAIQ